MSRTSCIKHIPNKKSVTINQALFELLKSKEVTNVKHCMILDSLIMQHENIITCKEISSNAIDYLDVGQKRIVKDLFGLVTPLDVSVCLGELLRIGFLVKLNKRYYLNLQAINISLSVMFPYKEHNFNLSFQPKKVEPAKQGFIYLMADTTNGFTKIGYSKKPKHRERTLQSEKPTIELIWKKEGTRKNEKELHKLFDHCRMRGEWFNLTRSDIELIKNYTFKN